MAAKVRETADESGDGVVDSRSYLAVAVLTDRRSALRVLTRDASEHFGRDQLFVRHIHVAATNSGAAFLASAQFTAHDPDA